MEYRIEIEGLVKRYGGSRPAVDGVSFAIRSGSCFGLLGPNGAGKSTTLKSIAGIITADAGTIKLSGLPLQEQRQAAKQQIGYVPQEITLYNQLSARQNLSFFGEMYGVRGSELKQRIAAVLEQVGLSARAGDAVGTYSGGMKRRINIAAALLHNPQIVVLDEPTVGIDPQSRNHIFEMIRELKRQGVTVIYSTHYMEEAEALCDSLAIIDHGKVVAQGSLPELLERHAVQAVYVEADGLGQFPPLGAFTARREGRGWIVETDRALQAMHELSGYLLQAGIAVRVLELVQPSLDSVFLKLTGTSLRD